MSFILPDKFIDELKGKARQISLEKQDNIDHIDVLIGGACYALAMRTPSAQSETVIHSILESRQEAVQC